jgi:hypothetical protein
MEVLVRFVAADGRILTEDRRQGRPGTTWTTPVEPCAASLHLMFEVPEKERACSTSANFHGNVLTWLKEEQKITGATEVVGVTGYGADWNGPGDFFGSFGIGVHWRDATGKTHHQDFGGDHAISLLCWMLAATQAPESPGGS